MTTEANPNPNPETPDAALAAAAAAANAAPTPPLEITAKPTAEEQALLDAANKPKDPPKDDDVVPVAYNPTGDTGLDMTLKFVGDLGYAPDHPAMAAAIEGDFSLLEAELAAKGVKGYEAYIKLGQKAYAEVSAKTKERMAKDKTAIEAIAGGEAQWKAVSEWAAANADDSEKTVIQSQLSKGGLEAQMAATWLVGLYNKAGNGSTEGAGPKVTSVTSGAAASTGALSPKEYSAAVEVARREHKSGDFETSPAYRALRTRRMAYKG